MCCLFMKRRARLIFYPFLEAAKKVHANEGRLPPNIRYDSLLFQTGSAHIDTSSGDNTPWNISDPFILAMWMLPTTTPSCCATLTTSDYSPLVLRIIESSSIHFVIDEPQAAGGRPMRAFSMPYYSPPFTKATQSIRLVSLPFPEDRRTTCLRHPPHCPSPPSFDIYPQPVHCPRGDGGRGPAGQHRFAVP